MDTQFVKYKLKVTSVCFLSHSINLSSPLSFTAVTWLNTFRCCHTFAHELICVNRLRVSGHCYQCWYYVGFGTIPYRDTSMGIGTETGIGLISCTATGLGIGTDTGIDIRY